MGWAGPGISVDVDARVPKLLGNQSLANAALTTAFPVTAAFGSETMFQLNALKPLHAVVV